MPNTWAHILFGEEVLSTMQGPEIAWAAARPDLFRLACQGPDLFFYYRFWPWLNTKGLDNIARKIQNVVGGEFVRTGVRWVKTLQPHGVMPLARQSFPQPVDNSGDNLVESEQYQSLVAYMIGFICHYALDATAHPYIHYKSGVYLSTVPATYKYYGNHQIFEATLDAILLREKRGLVSTGVPVRKHLDVGPRLPDVVTAFYCHQVAALLRMEIDEEVMNTAYRDMHKGLDLFYDPHGLKRWLLKVVKAVTFGKVNYVRYFPLPTQETTVDYLNRRKSQWVHPADATEVYHESFDELWERGKTRAKEWVSAMLDYLHGEIDDVELDRRIPHLSFSTGRKPEAGDLMKLQYFDPVVSLQ